MPKEKINILFVDDEAMLLQGLRRMLRGMRSDWNMTFTPGPREALSHLESNMVDVVVSDMRMPEMTGAELLAEVSERFPETIRIILSGYAENEAVLKTIGPSHQYLAKPCDASFLIDAIKRSLSIREHLSASGLRAFITGITDLPILPDVYTDFMAEIANRTATTDTIASVIERDIGLSATILKLTNSAYFSLPTRIVDIRQAVQLLGLETMRSLVAVAGLFEPKETDPQVIAFLSRLRDEALATASLAREVALAEGLAPADAEYACCAGLMHHLGYLLLLAAPGGDVAELSRLIDGHTLETSETERQYFGTNHAEAGAYLLSLWGFSDPIVEAVLNHHEPESHGAGFNVTAAVHVAQAVVTARVSEDRPIKAFNLNEDFIHALGKHGCIEAWLDMGAKPIEKGTMS